ncbi:alkaline phosphatase-like [Wyeomyia smithii]|uniref:alkaline phosphatase-like n=1 Tax=Wyeomyia smithii TaxID=174621 RepID=UPI002467C753|nr:alkaline phosphatase-like [Wyeomyia smithii]
MLNYPVVLIVCMVVSLTQSSAVRETYDTDHQHFRPRPAVAEKTKQKLGYDEIETTSLYWQQQAQDTLRSKLGEQPITTKAENVIFFIGAGMSAQTIAATRMYLGNENNWLSFERFPNLATARTFCYNQQVADGACTVSAYLSGVKTNYGMINVSPSVSRGSCEYDQTNAEFLGLMKWAQESGKHTGIVTNVAITDASPAGAYASVASRERENDAKVVEAGCDPTQYPDIAHQLVHGEVGKNLNVILGGGRKNLRPVDLLDEDGNFGARTDNRDLISEWLALHPNKARYVYNKLGLQTVDPNNTDHLLGIFHSGSLLYNLEAQDLQITQPELWELVDVAIKILSRNENGYVLFVENGKIDEAHHETKARLVLDETAQFSKAVDFARNITDTSDTLMLVSADHGHTMTYNGYPKRGNDVLGIAKTSDEDGLPYTTLSYANGPGYQITYTEENRGIRADISKLDWQNRDALYPATVPLDAATHGGEDVALYVSGPMAHTFQGNFEQNAIPYLIASAANIGREIRPLLMTVE